MNENLSATLKAVAKKRPRKKKMNRKLKVRAKRCDECGGTRKTGHQRLCKSGLKDFRRRCYVRYFPVKGDDNAAMRFSIFPGGKIYLSYVRATGLARPEEFEVSERTLATLEMMPKHSKQIAKAIMNKARQ